MEFTRAAFGPIELQSYRRSNVFEQVVFAAGANRPWWQAGFRGVIVLWIRFISRRAQHRRWIEGRSFAYAVDDDPQGPV